MLTHQNMHKKNFIITFILWSLSFVVCIIFIQKVVPYAFLHNDFYDYWIGAKLLRAGLSPYGIGSHFIEIKNNFHLHFHVATGYSYPPFTAWIMHPLSFVEPHIAAWIWMLCSLVQYAFLCYQFMKQYKNKWVYLFLLTFSPILYSIASGQINIFILMCLWIWLKKSKSWVGSLCFALVCVIKVYPVLLLLLFIVKKKWKMIFQIILFICLFILIPILFSGPKDTVYYFARVLPDLQNQTNGYFTYQSFISVLTRYFGEGEPLLLRSINNIFCLIVLAILMIYSLMSKKSLYYLGSLWMIGLSLLPGTTTFWNFAPMIFGVLIIWDNWGELKTIKKYLFISAIIISNFTWHSTFLPFLYKDVLNKEFYVALTSTGFLFGVILFILLLFSTEKREKNSHLT
ncbi:MAG: glycosyltransferase family 87 protein [Candidatus Roizmanbacteria bacterium]|nr:glycosyltransferase family 87 protein [Candidatus Roizmanbacteria bacterium]